MAARIPFPAGAPSKFKIPAIPHIIGYYFTVLKEDELPI
jgi:hypothetical protein